MKFLYLWLTLMFCLTFSLFPLKETEANHRSEISMGISDQHRILQYKFGLNDSWHLRGGFFSNLNPDQMTYHFNAGAEYRTALAEDAPSLFLGLDAVSLNYDLTERHELGGGPVAGFRYDITDRFNLSVEMGSTGYMSDDDFRWTWHRKVAMLFGWRF